MIASYKHYLKVHKGPFTQATFVAATRGGGGGLDKNKGNTLITIFCQIKCIKLRVRIRVNLKETNQTHKKMLIEPNYSLNSSIILLMKLKR